MSANSKKFKGNGTNTKIWKDTPIAAKSPAPESVINKRTHRKLANIANQKGCGGNNNGLERGNRKWNKKGRKVSFDGKKAAWNTNSRK